MRLPNGSPVWNRRTPGISPSAGMHSHPALLVDDLDGGRERRLHPQVQDGGAGTEPAAAPGGEGRRLRQLAHPEQPAVEGARGVFPPRRHRYLNMVESCDHRTSKYLDTKILNIKVYVDWGDRVGGV
jgi:hypothetical protein